MSAGNDKTGPIKLGKIGMQTFQYDEGYPEKRLDVILVSNQWREIDATFRAYGEAAKQMGCDEGSVPRNQEQDYLQAQHKFASELLEAPDMSMADAMHFMKLLTDEAEKLKPFFAPASEGKPSSPESTVVTFSE